MQHGYERLGKILTRTECEDIRNLYANPEHFRSRIEMKRFRFGSGEYQYFRYPLPPRIDRLRHELYTRLSGLQGHAATAASREPETPRPSQLDDFLAQCHEAGQTRPTPLLLRYREGDYNCLHQDLYGKIFFPYQVITCLSKPQEEFTGGELLLVEQRPRAQSVGHAIPLDQGEAVVITTARGERGSNFRHGVSPVLSGERYTLGLIFHDAV